MVRATLEHLKHYLSNVDWTLSRLDTVGEWLGFDTTVSFGPTGLGLTSSLLHDVAGPFGTMAQSLTVRPIG